MRPIEGGVCAICGERLFSSYAASGNESEPRCGLCRRIEPAFARAAAYGSYESGLRELIHLLKYGGVRPAANVLGRMLAEAILALEPEFGSDATVVIPVPLHRSKLRQRGFNQAELIARAALKLSETKLSETKISETKLSATKTSPSQRRFCLCPGVLERTRDTTSQTGLTSHQRRENLRGAFAVTRPHQVKGREVLVVDDVYTTGATVSECARVLRRAGASKVWVATVARTLKASAQHVEIRTSSDDAENEERIAGAEVALAKAVGI